MERFIILAETALLIVVAALTLATDAGVDVDDMLGGDPPAVVMAADDQSADLVSIGGAAQLQTP